MRAKEEKFSGLHGSLKGYSKDESMAISKHVRDFVMSCERTSGNASLSHLRFASAVWNLPLVHSLPRDPRILDPISEVARSDDSVSYSR